MFNEAVVGQVDHIQVPEWISKSLEKLKKLIKNILNYSGGVNNG